MDIAAVKELISALERSALYSLHYEDAAFRVTLSKGPQGAAPSREGDAVPGQEQGTGPPAGGPVPGPATGIVVNAPLVGTVFRAREPGAAPLVSVGDTVEKGQTLCLIEAMKMYSEVPAPSRGVVAEILFDDGALVEYGATLFRLEEQA